MIEDNIMELTLIENNGKFYIDSREVAEMTGKKHAHLCRDIEGYIAVINQTAKLRSDSQNPKLDSDDFFVESSYTAGTGKAYKCYLLTKKGCDMVANKMTGKKGILFTATYIDKFYEMENKLKEQPIPTEYQIKELDVKEKELSVKEQELKLRQSELYLKIADRTEIPEYKQIMNSLAVKAVSGEMYLPLPMVNKKTYSATEIGNILGVSANKIGRLASKHNMKTAEHGKLFYDKARNSNKEIETFRYYESAINEFRDLLEQKSIDKKYES